MLARIRKQLEEKDQGFTLIELLVVIIIIGILAAIAIPLYLNQQEKAKESAVKSDIKNAQTAVAAYLVDFPDATSVALADLDWSASPTTEMTTTTVTITDADFEICGHVDGKTKEFCIDVTGELTTS